MKLFSCGLLLCLGCWTTAHAAGPPAAGLSPPDLLSPADSATGVATNQAFQWASVTGATMYEITFSISVLFGTNEQVYTLEATTFTPPADSLQPGTEYFWRVRAMDDNEASDYSPTRRFSTATGVAREADLPPPDGFALAPAYPNPTRGATHFTFAVPQAAEVTLAVFDALGRRVAVPVSGRYRAGTHTVRWQPAGLPGGVYLARLQMGPHSLTRALVLAR